MAGRGHAIKRDAAGLGQSGKQNQKSRSALTLKFQYSSSFRLLLILAILVALFGCILVAVRTDTVLTAWDLSISHWVESRATTQGDNVATFLTDLGDYFLLRAGTLLAIAGLLIRRDWRRAGMFAALIVIEEMLTPILKGWVARPRPPFPQDSLILADYSFPSGHAVLAAAFYSMVAYLGWTYIRTAWQKWSIVTLSVGLILMVGLSRVYLGVHYVTDVVGGWLVGVGLFLLVWFVGETRFIHRRSAETTDSD